MINLTYHSACGRRGIVLLFAFALMALSTRVTLADEPGPLNFAYTYSVFALDDTSSLVELDYRYSELGLTYAKSEGRFVGKLLVTFQIWDSSGAPLHASSWITANPRPE